MKTPTLLLIAAATVAGFLAPAPLPIGQPAQTFAVDPLEVPPVDDDRPATLNPETPAPIFPQLETFTPETACNCDGLTEGDVRRIVREELEKFETKFAVKASPPPSTANAKSGGSVGGSTGGSVSAGSTGGSTSYQSVTWSTPSTPTVNYRAATTSRPTVSRSYSSTVCSGGTCTTYQRTRTRPRIFGGLFSR